MARRDRAPGRERCGDRVLAKGVAGGNDGQRRCAILNVRPLRASATRATRVTMRMEVHVHGNAFLCKGVRLAQVEQALRPWLEYLDVDTIAEAASLEREEPGIAFDTRERTLNICWTGEVGRSFHSRLTETLHKLGPLPEDASE